ncbi:MAG: aminotransferase class V-fold PLP-dependent enzyme [Bacteroidota bacterium]
MSGSTHKLMQLEDTSLKLLSASLKKLAKGFDLPKAQTHYKLREMEPVLQKVAEKMQDNFPYFHPLFAGQMLKPPHPIAKAAYMLAMWINPNNHAIDGGRASSKMEKKVVADIAGMFGWKQHLGHLTSGGTMANLEALWIAGSLHPGKKILASDQAHYTHQRISNVLKLPFETVKTDAYGIIDLDDLEAKLKTGEIGTVVCTMGTTGLGMVDPLSQILALRKKYDFRIHADAAYGGYFTLLRNLEEATIQKYQALEHVDSLVIDPHKQGLQPYGCGCILFCDPDVTRFYLHDSPYTYFTSDELHLGEISLECSRAGAAAVALWATHELLPLEKDGQFAQDLCKSRDAALELHKRIEASDFFFPIVSPETDIVTWSISGKKTSEINKRVEQLFEVCEENQLYLSLFKYPADKLSSPDLLFDSDHLLCLRSCLMKPEHLDWIDEIWKKLVDSYKMLE